MLKLPGFLHIQRRHPLACPLPCVSHTMTGFLNISRDLYVSDLRIVWQTYVNFYYYIRVHYTIPTTIDSRVILRYSLCVCDPPEGCQPTGSRRGGGEWGQLTQQLKPFRVRIFIACARNSSQRYMVIS